MLTRTARRRFHNKVKRFRDPAELATLFQQWAQEAELFAETLDRPEVWKMVYLPSRVAMCRELDPHGRRGLLLELASLCTDAIAKAKA